MSTITRSESNRKPEDAAPVTALASRDPTASFSTPTRKHRRAQPSNSTQPTRRERRYRGLRNKHFDLRRHAAPDWGRGIGPVVASAAAEHGAETRIVKWAHSVFEGGA